MNFSLKTPGWTDSINSLKIGEILSISGYIYTGRDAVLPKIVALIEKGILDAYGINLNGAVIFHTAVSPAGVGPTSSNKYEIESTMPLLSKADVKLHIGKGAISKETVAALDKYHSVYAITPPVTALLGSKILSQKVIAFPELGMEAFYLLEVEDFPIIIAAVHGKSIYNDK